MVINRIYHLLLEEQIRDKALQELKGYIINLPEERKSTYKKIWQSLYHCKNSSITKIKNSLLECR